jgi:hypothetical protein
MSRRMKHHRTMGQHLRELAGGLRGRSQRPPSAEMRDLWDSSAGPSAAAGEPAMERVQQSVTPVEVDASVPAMAMARGSYGDDSTAGDLWGREAVPAITGGGAPSQASAASLWERGEAGNGSAGHGEESSDGRQMGSVASGGTQSDSSPAPAPSGNGWAIGEGALLFDDEDEPNWAAGATEDQSTWVEDGPSAPASAPDEPSIEEASPDGSSTVETDPLASGIAEVAQRNEDQAERMRLLAERLARLAAHLDSERF